MISKVTFPKFDANIEEGVVGAWLKREGEEIKENEPLVEIITDKANFDLEAEASGILRKIIAAEKSNVPVGYVIALIGDPDDELPDVSEENEKLMEAHRAKVAAAERLKDQKPRKRERERRKRIRATPVARRIAREAGIELADVKLEEGKNIVTEEDVERYLQSINPSEKQT